MSDLHTIITSLGDRCPEDLRFYVETGHKAAFVVDVRRYAGRALAALCRVIREQDMAIQHLSGDNESCPFPRPVCPLDVDAEYQLTGHDCYRCWQESIMRNVREEDK